MRNVDERDNRRRAAHSANFLALEEFHVHGLYGAETLQVILDQLLAGVDRNRPRRLSLYYQLIHSAACKRGKASRYLKQGDLKLYMPLLTLNDNLM